MKWITKTEQNKFKPADKLSVPTVESIKKVQLSEPQSHLECNYHWSVQTINFTINFKLIIFNWKRNYTLK